MTQGAQLCDDLEGRGSRGRAAREGARVYMWPVHSIVQQGLAQHDKEQCPKKERKESSLSFFFLKKEGRQPCDGGHGRKSDLQDPDRSAVSPSCGS